MLEVFTVFDAVLIRSYCRERSSQTTSGSPCRCMVSASEDALLCRVVLNDSRFGAMELMTGRLPRMPYG